MDTDHVIGSSDTDNGVVRSLFPAGLMRGQYLLPDAHVHTLIFVIPHIEVRLKRSS